ncbi:hypothetical protein B7989_09925 [Fibrobacter sp. UWB5]|nr:hypothetical protein B7989_09925 [Fibrobacter sp. UWB5]
MRFYNEFGIFLPKIQNRIEQKYKTKLDNFTKRIVLIGNLSDQLIFFWGGGLPKIDSQGVTFFHKKCPKNCFFSKIKY